MDIIKDNPFWEEKRVYSKAEAWIYLQENDISIRETSKLFGWSTTKLYAFLKEIKKTLKKTAKKTPSKDVTVTKTSTSLEVTENKKTPKKTDKKTLEERKLAFGNKLVPYMDKYGREMIREFFDYWTEINDDGRLMRFEKEDTFSTAHRLGRWDKNQEKYGATFKNSREQRLAESAKRKQELIEYAIKGDSKSEDIVF